MKKRSSRLVSLAVRVVPVSAVLVVAQHADAVLASGGPRTF